MPWDFGETDEDPPIWHYHPIDKYRGKKRKFKGPLDILLHRQDWGAMPPTSTERIRHDAPFFLKVPAAPYANHVHLSHTNTVECSGVLECAEVLRSLQKKHIEKGEPDILHSFMVGGDGKIYEGRGWDNQANVPDEFTMYQSAALEVALIGDFSNKKPPKPMITSAKRLLEWGIFNKKLHCCYDKSYNFELYNMYLGPCVPEAKD